MPLLFSRTDIFSVAELQREQLRQEVARLESATLEQISEQEVVRELASKYKLEVPTLEEEKAFVAHREVDVDVSRDPMRLILDRSQPFYVRGVELTFCVPFRGDPSLFEVRPASYNLNPPHAEIQGNEVHLVYARTDNNPTAAKAQYEEALRNIKQYIGWLQNSVQDFNSKIGQEIENYVQQRKLTLNASARMVAGLGLPVKSPARGTQAETARDNRPLQKSINSSKKWDVFISHASEDKIKIARPLAAALSAAGVSVWYDEFALKMGDSLRASIDYGLANSRYGVVILSRDFFSKHWPVQELNGLASREVNSKKVILPIWHDVSFDEVRGFSPILADRVAANSNEGVGRLVDQVLEIVDKD
jgi:hypothetical protein